MKFESSSLVPHSRFSASWRGVPPGQSEGEPLSRVKATPLVPLETTSCGEEVIADTLIVSRKSARALQRENLRGLQLADVTESSYCPKT